MTMKDFDGQFTIDDLCTAAFYDACRHNNEDDFNFADSRGVMAVLQRCLDAFKKAYNNRGALRFEFDAEGVTWFFDVKVDCYVAIRSEHCGYQVLYKPYEMIYEGDDFVNGLELLVDTIRDTAHEDIDIEEIVATSAQLLNVTQDERNTDV